MKNHPKLKVTLRINKLCLVIGIKSPVKGNVSKIKPRKDSLKVT